ncbi:MAG TPA: hypothetical protein VFF40_09495 [Acidimicrobiia bacterium]|nr:hypothetical protein [Acidimicrobiia bacterium]
MEIAPNARKHGVRAEDMHHAILNAIRTVEQDSSRTLFIGPARDGAPLEVVVTDDAKIIHAMPLRRTFYRYLR